MNITFFKFLKYCGYFLVLAALSVSIAFNIQQNKQNSEIKKINSELITVNEELNKNLTLALEKTAISFAISPKIDNKFNSTFGSTKQVTIQNYFTLDGKAMLLNNPDSTLHITKVYP